MAAPPYPAAEKTGTVYVIDLVGFSRLTEDRISTGEKSGTEDVTRLVTELFTQLTSELSAFNIKFGGFAGDALIAWQADGPSPLSELELQSIATRICEHVWSGLTCRTAHASGTFWVDRVNIGSVSRPLVWGRAVSNAFDALSKKPRQESEASLDAPSRPVSPAQMLATASVSNRWAIILRVLTPDACKTAAPDKVKQTITACRDISQAFSAEIDNLVQDDKGLIIIIVLPHARREDQSVCDALIANLTTGRQPLIDASQAAAIFGTLFRCRPMLSNRAVPITIGSPLNQAAKTLGSTDPRLKPQTSAIPLATQSEVRELVGRDTETEILCQALRQSRSAAHTATLIGAAGIGKTALVRTVDGSGAERSVHVDVTPGDRYLPFGCAQDLAEACNVPAKSVFEQSGQIALAQNLPHTVIIENWQWCDDDSKRLIRQLQTERDTGLLLITSRQEILDLDAQTEIQVAPLSLEQAGQLVESLAPNVLGRAQIQSVFDVASGTPFWLVQAALHYAETSRDRDELTVLSGLESLLTARAQDLSDPAIALWRLHCAWRLPLEFEPARELLMKFNIAISVEHLEELQALGWLSTDLSRPTNGLRPAHDILADWGGADLPVTFERSLHTQIARSVRSMNGAPSRIARHWQSADQKLRAAIWFRRAARVADRAGAHRLTVEHLAQAEALCSNARQSNQTRALQHLAILATANWGVGKLRRAKQTLIEFDTVAKTLPNSQKKRRALQRAAAIQSEVGQFAGNANLILSGMYRGWRNRQGTPDAYEVKARRDGFIYYLLGLSRLPVSGRFNHLISQAHALGEYRSETLIGCAAGTLHMSRCEWPEAEAVLGSCYTAIAQTDDRQMLGVVQCLHALCNLYQGRAEDSFAWFEMVAETGREQDHHLFQVWGAYGKAEAQLYAGSIDDARRYALTAKQKSVGLGDLQSVCIIEGILAQIALRDGDTDCARKHARNAMRFSAKLPPTNFSTLEGIAATAQIGCALKAAGLADPDLKTMIQTGRKALKNYARVFRLARPRHHYVEGLIARANGNERRAQSLIKKASRTASDLGMAYERGLAEQALGLNKEIPHAATAKIH